MAWDTKWALEGIFMFGAPLNVYQYVIDTGKFGQSTETYHVAHFQIDDDTNLWTRIMERMKGPIEYFPKFFLMERLSRDSFQYRLPYTFYKPWLFSLTRDFRGTQSPFDPWPGPTLGIACYKKDNPHITTTDW